MKALPMSILQRTARTSNCKRLKVACEIMSSDFDGCVGWNSHIEECNQQEGACGAEHAEMMALDRFLDRAELIGEIVVTCTHSPCSKCARELEFRSRKATSKTFRYGERYRDAEGLRYLKAHGWKIVRVKTK